MGKYEKLTPNQEKRLNEFIMEAIFLSEEESAAIDHQIPMTQELFEKCIDHCSKIDAQFTLNELIIQYPEFSAEYSRKIEEAADIDLSEEEIAEKTKKIWEKICDKIEERHGEELA